MFRVLPIAAVATLLLVGACSSSTTSTTTDTSAAVAPANTATPSDLRERSREFVASWNQDDPTVVLAFYTPTAVVTQGDSTYSGSDRIRNNFLAGLAGVSDLTVSEQVFTGSGNEFVERGSYKFMMTPEGQAPQAVSGTYETTWRKESGKWVVTTMKVHESR